MQEYVRGKDLGGWDRQRLNAVTLVCTTVDTGRFTTVVGLFTLFRVCIYYVKFIYIETEWSQVMVAKTKCKKDIAKQRNKGTKKE